MKPFIYVHELIYDKPSGIWVGCDEEASVHGAYIEGETGKEVIALYHEKDVKELIQRISELENENRMASE